MNHSIKILLGLTAVLSTLTALALDPPEPTVKAHYLVSGNWSELKRGKNILSIRFTHHNQVPITGAAVTIEYDMVGMPMSPPNTPVIEKGDGVYEREIFIGMKGDWKFDVTVDKDSVPDSATHTQKISN